MATHETPAPPASPAPPAPGWADVLRRAGLEVGKAVILTLVCAGVAIGVNAARGRDRGGIDLVARAPYDIYTDCPEMDAQIPHIPAASLVSARVPVIFVDARPTARYLAGHLPGARSLPMYGTHPNAPQGIGFLRGQWGRFVVVYGTDQMQSAVHLASYLRQQKVGGVVLLRGDIAAWRAAGGTLKTRAIPRMDAAAARKRQGVVFVDARPTAAFAEGHLPGARSLPFNGLVPPAAKAFAGLLRETRPVVVYGVEGVDEELADPEHPAKPKDVGKLLAAELLALGARNVVWLPGGTGAWEDAGGTLARSKPRPRQGDGQGGTP